jgi:hypothetical protein
MIWARAAPIQTSIAGVSLIAAVRGVTEERFTRSRAARGACSRCHHGASTRYAHPGKGVAGWDARPHSPAPPLAPTGTAGTRRLVFVTGEAGLGENHAARVFLGSERFWDAAGRTGQCIEHAAARGTLSASAGGAGRLCKRLGRHEHCPY